MSEAVRGDETGTGGSPDLTEFQLDVARMFFALPASKGFLRPLVKEQTVGRELE
jgi:hypothetical protein